METEAYRVGVGIALSGNTARVVQQIAAEFTKLDEVIQKAAGSISGLVSGVRLLRTESEGLSRHWRDLAANATKFANATRSAAGNTGRAGGTGGGEGPATGSLSRLSSADMPRSYRPNFTMLGEPYDPARQPTANLPVPSSYYQPKAYESGDAPFNEPEDRRIPLNYRQPGPAFGKPPSSMRPNLDPLAAGVGTYGGYKVFQDTYNAAAEVDHLKSELLKQGMSPEQVGQAYAKAIKTQQTVLPSSLTGNLEIASTLMAITQRADEAIKMMPEFARTAAVLAATGHGGELEGLTAAARSGEFLGVLGRKNPKTGEQEVDPTRLQEFLSTAQAMSIATHGSIGPEALYSFLKASGIGGALLARPEELYAQMPIIQSLGASRAGTGLNAFSQQFSGTMSQAGASMLTEMGILHGGTDVKHNPYLKPKPIGHVMLLPGAMDPGMQQMALESPRKFIEQYLVPKEEGYLSKKYGKTYDNADDQRKLEMLSALTSQLSSRIPGGTYWTETIRNMPLIYRDIEAGKAAQKRDAYATQVQNDPTMQSKALTSSLQALEAVLGDATMAKAVTILNSMTGSLNGLGDWARGHPDGTQAALTGLAGGIAALGAGAVITALLALGPTGGLLAGLGASISGLYAAAEYMKKKFPGPQSPEEWSHTPFTRLWADRLLHEWFGPSAAPGSGPPNGVAPTGPVFGPQSAPHAPIPATSDGSPINVHVSGGSVAVSNPHDLTTGVASGIASQMNGPNSGTLSHDPKIDAGSAWIGYP